MGLWAPQGFLGCFSALLKGFYNPNQPIFVPKPLQTHLVGDEKILGSKNSDLESKLKIVACTRWEYETRNELSSVKSDSSGSEMALSVPSFTLEIQGDFTFPWSDLIWCQWIF